MLEAPHAHDCRQRLWKVRMIVDADKALARADGEETLRAARRQGYDSMHSAVQQERPGQIINREARAGGEACDSSRGAARLRAESSAERLRDGGSRLES